MVVSILKLSQYILCSGYYNEGDYFSLWQRHLVDECFSSTGRGMEWIQKSTPFMETSNLANVVQGNVPLERQLVCPSSLSDVDMDLREVYFLILHFLSSGPCERTFGHLRDEILEKGLLPRRYHSWWSRSGTCSGRADDDGISLPLSYDNLVERYSFLLWKPCPSLLKCSVTCLTTWMLAIEYVFEGSHLRNCANCFCPP